MALSNRGLSEKVELELDQLNLPPGPDLSCDYLHRLAPKLPTIGALSNLEADVFCEDEIMVWHSSIFPKVSMSRTPR